MKMTNLLLGAAAIAITLGTANFAYATNWGNDNGPTNNTTNNYNDNSTTNNPVANGGAGGNGYGGNANQNQGQYQGQTANGGTGIGVGIGQGGDANSSANAGAVSGSSSDSKSNASSGSVSGAYSGGNKQASSQNVTVEGDNFEAAANGPVMGSLAVSGNGATNGSCLGTTQGGVGIVEGIFSFGTSWTQEECDRRYNAIRAEQQGLLDVSIGIMCNNSEYKDALRRANPEKYAKLCADDSEALVINETGEKEVAYKETETSNDAKNPRTRAFYNKFDWFKGADGQTCWSESKTGGCTFGS